MKVKQLIMPLLAVAALASCGGNSSSATGLSTPAEESSQATSSQSAPMFEAYTLSQLHEARVAKTLANLDKKFVAIKGKVTFAKHVRDEDGVVVIQNGKFAVEVTYPSKFNVNVGDPVEVKGAFAHNKVGSVDTIWVSTYDDVVSNAEIKVIDEAISVETVTIAKEADLYEYDVSKASIDFNVTGNRKNAAFVGKLSEGDAEFIVSNRLDVAEKFPEAPYAEGDKVKYEGLVSTSGDGETKVIRYFDKAGFSKIA